MSSKLKPIDLTGAVIGGGGTIDFNSFPKFAANDVSNKAHIRMLNESGCGLDIVFGASGNSHTLPAGAWATFELAPNDGNVTVIVTYIIPGAPVTQVMAVYYAPGETVPQAFTLGNSPIGIGGTVATSSVQTLSNETAVLGTKIVDIGTLTIADLFDLWNDHFLIKVQQAGVAHQVLAGNTAGVPLQLGQAGDIAEVLGQFLIDQCASGTATPSTGTGSATVYEFVFGPLKLVGILNDNLKNTSVTKFTIALPTPFTKSALFLCGNTTTIEFLASGVAQTETLATGFNAGLAGTTGTSSQIFSYNVGDFAGPFDTIRFGASNSTAHSSIMFLLGV